MRQEHLESSRKAGEPLKRRVLRNAHLIALGLAVLFWVFHLLGWLFPLPAGAAEVRVRVDEMATQVEDAVANRRFPAAQINAEAQDLGLRVAASHGPASGEAPTLNPGVVYPKKFLDAVVKGETNEIRFLPPRDLRADAERGKIALRWLVDADSNVSVTQFEVWRSRAGAPFERVAPNVPGSETSWVDDSVKPGVTYSYRVLAQTNEPLLVAAGRQKTAPSMPITQDAITDYRIEIAACADDGRTATLEVEKWYQDTWWKKSFTVARGDPVGALDAGSGVDYGTGRSVASLTREIVESEVVRDEVVFGPDGTVLLEAGLPVTEEVKGIARRPVVTLVLTGGGLPDKTYTLDPSDTSR